MELLEARWVQATSPLISHVGDNIQSHVEKLIMCLQSRETVESLAPLEPTVPPDPPAPPDPSDPLERVVTVERL